MDKNLDYILLSVFAAIYFSGLLDYLADLITVYFIQGVNMDIYKNIGVWEVTFYRHDDNGNQLKDAEGKVIKYRADDLTIDDLLDGLELEDLTEA